MTAWRFGILVGAWLAFGSGLMAQEVSRFREVWGYVVDGSEASLATTQGLTDVAYFSASLTSLGALTGVPKVDKLKAFPGRKHLVLAALDNVSLAHLVLNPAYGLRQTLLKDLAKASEGYDGVQLDFEAVSPNDKEHFRSFLKELKSLLGSKVLSCAVPARTSAKDEVFDYRALAPLVDRLMVMAYDEHWSGGPPGPVASLDWGKRVANYALSVVPGPKLILGAPFYGRAWADKRTARALTSAQVQAEKGLGVSERKNGIPTFTYVEPVTVTVFYEDRQSQTLRLNGYFEAGITAVAFWRIGHEAADFWTVDTAPGLGE